MPSAVTPLSSLSMPAAPSSAAPGCVKPLQARNPADSAVNPAMCELSSRRGDADGRMGSPFLTARSISQSQKVAAREC